jgi:6-phosphogluconolactonase
VAAVPEADPPRVTLTLPILNQARQVVFLVTGARKARVMREVLQEPPDPLRRPAQGVRPGPGRILWMVDAEAAAGLSRIW